MQHWDAAALFIHPKKNPSKQEDTEEPVLKGKEENMID